MKKYFLKLFKYNEWANNRILEIMLKDTFNDEETIKLFSHIITVQMIWMDRLLNKKNELEIWIAYNIEACIALSKENSAAWMRFVERLDDNDFSQMIKYTNTKEILFENSVEDIITHVINHSTYHRAQIAKQLRKIGIDPPGTDYIIFAREEG